MQRPGEGKEILFCPNCGYDPRANDYLNINSSAQVYELSLKPVQEKFICTQCNYKGNLFSVPEHDVHKLEFDLDALDAPIKHAQKGNGRFYLYFLGFLILIFLMLQTSSILLSAALAVILMGAILFLELRARTAA